MKKMRCYMLAVVFAMSMMALTACGKTNNGSAATQSTTQSATQSTTQGTSAGESGSASGMEGSNGASGEEESSTGVIDGLMDDVEKGADDLLDGTEEGSRGTDESR